MNKMNSQNLKLAGLLVAVSLFTVACGKKEEDPSKIKKVTVKRKSK